MNCLANSRSISLATVCLGAAPLLTVSYAQASDVELSPTIELQRDERLTPNPLTDHPGGLSLHTYSGSDLQRLRVRRLDAELAVTGQQDLHPPAGYRAVKWVPIADGHKVVAVLMPSGASVADSNDHLLLIGYDTYTGEQTFACEGPRGLSRTTPPRLIQTGVGEVGGHTAVALLFEAESRGQHTTAVVLTLDLEGHLETRAVVHDFEGIFARETLVALTLEEDGTAYLALASSDSVHLLQASLGADAFERQSVQLPPHHRALVFAWSRAAADAKPTLLGLSSSARPWRKALASFAVALGEEVGEQPALTAHVDPPGWPASWRRLAGKDVAFAKPVRALGEDVAFAAQRVRTRRGGHPKQGYRPRERILGDIVVALVEPEGTVEASQTIERNLKTSLAGSDIGALQLIGTPSGVGVIYGDEADSYFGTRELPGTKDTPGLTIWRQLEVEHRGRIVHDDSEQFHGLPATAHRARGLGYVFLTVERPGETGPSRVRVALAGKRTAAGR